MNRFLKYILLPVVVILPIALYGLDDTYLSVYWYGDVGDNTSGGNESLTVGYNNISSGSRSAAIGTSLQNYQPDSLVVGQYNAPVAGNLFTVGNGIYIDPLTGTTTRRNALSVTTDGVNIPGTAEITNLSAQGGIANFTGSAPAWWSSAEHGFLNSSAGTDQSPANIGQLKHVASRARLYLDFHLAKVGGAGPAIATMCSFSYTVNYAPATVGQLKNVARLFYTRLNQFDGPARLLPWNGITHPENAAPITVGQLKNAFAFQFTPTFLEQNANAASSGTPPPWWISYYGLQNSDLYTDTDIDGIPDLVEYATGSDPGDEDSDDDYAPDKEEIIEGFLPRDNTSAPIRLCWLLDDTRLGMNYVGPNPPPWLTNYYSEFFYKIDARGGVLQPTGRGAYPEGGVLGVIDFAAQIFPTSQNTQLNAWNFPLLVGNEGVGRSHVKITTEGDDHYNTQTVHLWLRGPKTDSPVTRTFPKLVKRTMLDNIWPGPGVVDVSPPDEPFQILTFTIPPNSNKSASQSFNLIQSTTMGPAPVLIPLPKFDYSEDVDAYLLPIELYADQGKIHLGFDPPNSTEGDPPTEYWASVIKGGSSTILNLRVPLVSYLGELKWKIDSGDETFVDISPKIITQEITKLTIEGKTSPNNEPKDTTIQLMARSTANSAAVPVITLKVKVLPQREKQIAVYTLEDPNSLGTQFASPPVVTLPTANEILAVCNDCFKQAGVRFTVHSSGAYEFPYDTRGFDLEQGYSQQLPLRDPDGKVTSEERVFLSYSVGTNPAVFDSIFPVPRHDPNTSTTLRLVLMKESGVPYDVAKPDGPKTRGFVGGVILFVRSLNGNDQVTLAAAHEIGHDLKLATADDDPDSDHHDQPPFPYAVDKDQPNNISPVKPSNIPFAFGSRMAGLLPSGAPDPAGELPWLYGRWMRHEDWDMAIA